MKVFFLKEDSLYKIFKTLQKLPKNKQIEIYIENQSPFFQHERRWQQIKELIEKKWLNVIFMTWNKNNKEYYKKLWLPNKYLKESQIKKALKLIYLFFFNIKKFHLQLQTKSNNYIFYLILSFEWIVVLWILYLLYWLVLPKTVITIHPAYKNEEIVYNFRYYPHTLKDYPQTTNKITIPYYTWLIKLKHSSSLSLDEILFKQTPAKWTVRIINTTKEWFTIVKWTQLITDQWLIFRTQKIINIPPADENWYWIVYVNVIADKYDIKNKIIWVRWNLKKDTRLYIRKLKQSFYKKEIYAEVVYDFEWWTTVKKANVTQNDIEELKKKIDHYISTQKISAIKTTVQKDWKRLLIPFKNFIIEKKSDFKYYIPSKIVTWATISWTLEKQYIYYYIYKKDLINWFKKYLYKRIWDVMWVVNFNEHSITFLENKTPPWSNILIIPTKINVVRWYDFQKDVNGIFEDIKENILWKPLKGKDWAYNYILQFNEIWDVKIQISPPWYWYVSKLKSRIYFKIKE